jgi:(S)-2-hydroxyglutarate dehydrogenase
LPRIITTETADLVVIGGGVIGCATVAAVQKRYPKLRTYLLEAESELALHQSGRNSGVVHVGYNQKPGTIKARFVVEGNRRLREFCKQHKVPLVEDGILVVAQNNNQLPVIEQLYKQGCENGARLSLVDAKELRDREPYSSGVAALYAPEGASFDSRSYVQALAQQARDSGARIVCDQPVVLLAEETSNVVMRTRTQSFKARVVVNAGGLHADRLAHQLDVGTNYKIIPFRGEYYELKPDKRELVKTHLYAAPDLNFPFLGVHFSRTFDGHVTIGPGAVLAPGRAAYTKTQFNCRDLLDMMSFKGFWRMFASKDFRQQVQREWKKSFFKSAVYEEARQLVPQLRIDDLVPYRAGIRAQVVNGKGDLVDDLIVEETPRSIHVLNAVSPALTCSLPFADDILSRLESKLG